MCSQSQKLTLSPEATEAKKINQLHFLHKTLIVGVFIFIFPMNSFSFLNVHQLGFKSFSGYLSGRISKTHDKNSSGKKANMVTDAHSTLIKTSKLHKNHYEIQATLNKHHNVSLSETTLFSTICLELFLYTWCQGDTLWHVHNM